MITYEIPNYVYEALANKILNSIKGTYFNTKVEVVDEDVEIVFSVSAFIYTKREIAEDYDIEKITDIVPVWWECHTYLHNKEIINNVSFNVLKNFLL